MSRGSWTAAKSETLLEAIGTWQDQWGRCNALNFHVISKRVQGSTGTSITVKSVKNQFSVLKKGYYLWHRFESSGDVECDPVTGAILGDDAWWESKITIDDSYKKFYRHPLSPLTKDLCARVFNY